MPKEWIRAFLHSVATTDALDRFSFIHFIDKETETQRSYSAERVKTGK